MIWFGSEAVKQPAESTAGCFVWKEGPEYPPGRGAEDLHCPGTVEECPHCGVDGRKSNGCFGFSPKNAYPLEKRGRIVYS